MTSQRSDCKEATIISDMSFIEGDLISQDTIAINGNIKSKNIIGKHIIIGKKAKIEGRVQGNIVEVAGEVNGNIEAEDSLYLFATSTVQGAVYTPNLEIEDGATIDGSCNIFDANFEQELLEK